MTRAKKMLVIVGTEKYLKEISPFDRIVEKVYQENWVSEVQRLDDQLANYLPQGTPFEYWM